MDEPSVVAVGCHWHDPHSELAYVIRSLAGAASRWAPVSVLTPGLGGTEPDGAFDVFKLGEPGNYRWPHGVPRNCLLIVDDVTAGIAQLLADVVPRKIFCLTAAPPPADESWQTLRVARRGESPRPFAKIHVPVNPLAKVHRHNGFGFTDYLLVLSDRTGIHRDPVPAVSWLTAAFHETDVIVVENGVASAWRGRALRGRASVDSRMDLWRLIAHARVCIDLAPGHHIARECIEALRLGTPIAVPAGIGPGAAHALAGGGWTFSELQELFHAVASVQTDATRARASDLGRSYADANHGDPEEFVRSLRTVLLEGEAPEEPAIHPVMD